MRKRNPELFWNAETLARALDVSLDEIMLYTRLDLIPAAVRIHDALLWRAADIRAWAKAARAATPAEAVATLWNAWQQDNDLRNSEPHICNYFDGGTCYGHVYNEKTNRYEFCGEKDMHHE